MEAKEKAKELFQKYYNNYGYYGIPVDAIKHSKQCTLIAVENEYKSLRKFLLSLKYSKEITENAFIHYLKKLTYDEVKIKNEINKL